VNIRIGTSGFSYDDWKGHFYPRSLPRGEMLGYYARHFRTVEINSTYYRLPGSAVMAHMAERVPPGFDFVVKAHQEMTHSGQYVPGAFALFRETVEPLRRAGVLGGVLAQFPFSFKRTARNEAFLGILRQELAEDAVIVEFRNAEWIDDGTLSRLRELGLGFCSVDEPPLKGLVPPVAAATSPVGYVRFHGRNSEKWWKHEQAWERYDYLYNDAELGEWTPRVQEIAAQTERTYVFFNNCHQGQAGQNARRMATLLHLEPPPDPTGQDSLSLGLD